MQRRIPRRAVNGVLLLDKPLGLSSNHALQQARRLFNAAKAGHTGTLDPMATGLLPLAFGEATKFSQLMLDADKAYAATAALGTTTTTGDAEGEALKVREPTCSVADVEQVLRRFCGAQSQVPPMYSALKRGGQPLYELARQGIEVPREARQVHIHELRMVAFDGVSLSIEVRCSKGTYIRTLAEDIGEALGCGAHLTALRRTAIGPFDVSQAVPLDALAEREFAVLDAMLEPVDCLARQLAREELCAQDADAILNGGSLERPDLPQGTYRLYGPDGFLGVGRVDNDGRLWPKRLISTQRDTKD